MYIFISALSNGFLNAVLTYSWTTQNNANLFIKKKKTPEDIKSIEIFHCNKISTGKRNEIDKQNVRPFKMLK